MAAVDRGNDLKRRREEWKRQAIFGRYTPEDLDYRKLKAEWDAERDRPPPEPEPPPEISLETRFQGIYACARPGTGKTQLIQHFQMDDLDMVARGEASMVVQDPTGDVGGKRPSLINVLTRLKRFAPGGDLYGKLIYIDPTDEDYTLPINLLSVRPTSSNAEAISSAISSYLSIFRTLMEQPLTGFQDPVFRYGVQVALAFPNPTLETLQDVIALTPDGAKPVYENIFDQLDPAVQRYLRRTYETRGPQRSRQEIMSRLDGLNADPLFRQIFNGHRTTIDFNKLINEPHVIIINASRRLGSMKELYGRYFLSMIKQAAEGRGDNAIPCFVYIDECDEFADANVGDIIRKLRRNRVALFLANQEVERIRDDAREAILGVAVKFINATAKSAREIAANIGLQDANGRINTAPLVNRPDFNFALHIAGQQEPVEYTLTPFAMNKELRMEEHEWQQVRQAIRDRYYEPIKRARATQTSTTTPQRPQAHRPWSDDDEE